MKATQLTLGKIGDTQGPWLQLAGPGHQELLRIWRNANAARFYDQSEISPGKQLAWFTTYQTREQDYLFVVMASEMHIGCMGIRLIGETWDLYNIIRGSSSPESAGFMSLALRLMIEFARNIRPLEVRAEVLTDNPALAWYLRNGFVSVDQDEKCITLQYPGPQPRRMETRR